MHGSQNSDTGSAIQQVFAGPSFLNLFPYYPELLEEGISIDGEYYDLSSDVVTVCVYIYMCVYIYF